MYTCAAEFDFMELEVMTQPPSQCWHLSPYRAQLRSNLRWFVLKMFPSFSFQNVAQEHSRNEKERPAVWYQRQAERRGSQLCSLSLKGGWNLTAEAGSSIRKELRDRQLPGVVFVRFKNIFRFLLPPSLTSLYFPFPQTPLRYLKTVLLPINMLVVALIAGRVSRLSGSGSYIRNSLVWFRRWRSDLTKKSKEKQKVWLQSTEDKRVSEAVKQI